MLDAFEFADELGPCKIVHVYEPALGLKATLVVDNVAIGPAIGGMRMAPDATTEECARLARAMTLKNAAAGLRHGGAKSVIRADHRMPLKQKEKLVRAFACALRGNEEYIFGPDMGTDERAMAWVHDEIGRAVGLPASMGGIPLDVLGATAWGLRHGTEVAARYSDLDLEGARLVVQGFGAVGEHSARFLHELGVVLVGAADLAGSIYDANGLDIEELAALKRERRSVRHANGTAGERDDVIGMPCDIWVPAARPDVITIDNVDDLDTRIVMQGANIPCTHEAELRLHERGIICVPDFVANAGGVICGAMEYAGMDAKAAFRAIGDKVGHNTDAILAASREQGITPRAAGDAIALGRVKDAMEGRRWTAY